MQKSFVNKFHSINVIDVDVVVYGLSISNMRAIESQLQMNENDEHGRIKKKHAFRIPCGGAARVASTIVR